jgi:hypothetical protein
MVINSAGREWICTVDENGVENKMVTDAEVQTAFYCSSNGDQWYLIEELRLKKMCVRHQANLASGGKSSVIDVSAFLSEGHGPQHEALLQLLAKPNQENG